MPMQLPLTLRGQEYASWDNFYVNVANVQLVNYLKFSAETSIKERSIYLYGNKGSGLSHLLQACCQASTTRGQTAAYLPLAQPGFLPEILDGLETLDLICIDDLESIAGNAAWEEALFHCYNRLLTTKTSLIFASHLSLKKIPLSLADLVSRLAASVVFRVADLADEDKLIVLQHRAKERGLELPTEVGRYLLNRYPRHMQILFNVLEKLDFASLAAQRRLTIPFVKQTLVSI